MAAPPGPINIMILNDVLRKSSIAAMLVGLGAASADGIFFLAVFFTGTRVLGQIDLVRVLYPLGAAFLFYLGTSLHQGPEPATRNMLRGQGAGGYLKGLTVGITNPLQIGWWITVGLPLSSLFGLSFAGGFFSGIFTWLVCYISLLSYFRQQFLALTKYVKIMSGLILVGFGAYFFLKFLTAIV